MSDARMPMTPEGYEALKAELKHLKSVERPQVIEAIEVAREHGDLKENAEYHAAKEQQSFIEGRTREIDDRLARAEVIDITDYEGDRVVFGATVVAEDMDSGEELKYRIVGQDEADLAKGMISITSPVARALIGSEEGDEVKVRAPGGLRTFGIVSIRFGA